MTLLLIAVLGGAHAAEVRVAPEPYFRHAEFAQMRLSPSGRTIAAVAAVNGRRGLVSIDLETRKPRVVAALADSDVRDFAWVNDKRLVFDVIDMEVGSGEQRGGGLFAIDVDGSNFRTLAPTLKTLARSGQFVYRYMALARTLNDGSDDVLALSNERNRDYPDLVRLNTREGRKTLLTDDWPGNPVQWIADRNGNVRAAVTTEKGIKFQTWWRESRDAKWRLIGEYGLRDPVVVPVAFDADGSLIVASDVGRKTAALYRFDATRNAPGEMLAEHGSVDLGRVVTDRRDGKIVGVAYAAAKEGVAWFDDDWASIASLVNRALPDHFNSISRGAANRMLVTSQSDTDPGSWYLLDLDSRKLEYLASARKDLVAAKMPAREVVSYKARDGLVIPAVLTLPKGREAKGLPLIMLVHGGPYVQNWRVSWRNEPAFLAALGYAVLEPEFRGSLGFGREHFQAGWKQWGQRMQDDLIDGIDWLAARGTIDPKRVCIMGASYGGYAVMMGLARDPDRYRCGINYVGVTDIALLFTVTWSDLSNSDFIRYGAKELIGDPDKDAALFKANSPLENAKKIRAPVLMAYGVEDRRVPLVHGERMRDALRANGTPVEWVTYSEEGHGFLLEKNRFDFYNRVADFLGKHLPAD
ncbi:MAG TPA: S9 family peptidase [Casimicrobiaceae bacterium]|nr:S9 family peptidase [Casimicrobiaceae bacterium]